MKKILAIVLTLVMSTMLFAGVALADGDDKSITVTGKATVQIAPDMAVVTLGVTETSNEVVTAQTTVNEKVNAMVEALVAEGVDKKDIGTNYMSIYPQYNYDYQTGEQTFKGYTADTQLSIKVRDLDRAGALIDIALQAGANQLNNITFTRENNTDAVDKALTHAVEDATRKAGVIAAAAGVNIKGVISVKEDYTYYYDGAALNRTVAYEDAASGGETNVQAGMLDVSMTVTVEFEIDK